MASTKYRLFLNILFALILLDSLTPLEAAGLCVVTMDYSPVCGSDGRVYINRRELLCAIKETPGLEEADSSKCPSWAEHQLNLPITPFLRSGASREDYNDDEEW